MRTAAGLTCAVRIGVAALSCVFADASLAVETDDARINRFDDPFVQLTHGLAGCRTPTGPVETLAEMRAETHSRVERGTSCHQSGRCRLPNAYLYDREIMPRVQKAIDADGRFADTSVWAYGQRRWIYLDGCVRTREQAEAIERLVRGIDDVEAVIDRLQVHDSLSKDAGVR